MWKKSRERSIQLQLGNRKIKFGSIKLKGLDFIQAFNLCVSLSLAKMY